MSAFEMLMSAVMHLLVAAVVVVAVAVAVAVAELVVVAAAAESAAVESAVAVADLNFADFVSAVSASTSSSSHSPSLPQSTPNPVQSYYPPTRCPFEVSENTFVRVSSSEPQSWSSPWRRPSSIPSHILAAP